jgi:PmbA protein
MEKKSLLEWMVDEARRQGAKASEFYYQKVERTEVQVSGGIIDNLTRAVEEGLGARIEARGGAAFSYTADLKKSTLRDFLKEAVAASNIAANPGFSQIPDPEKAPTGDMLLCDESHDSDILQEMMNCAKEIENSALGVDKRIASVDMASVEEERRKTELINSRGFSGAYSSDSYQGLCICIGRSEHSGSFGYDYTTSRRFRDLSPASIGRQAAVNTLFSLDGTMVRSQRALVVFSPMASNKFLQMLFNILSGENLSKRRTFLCDLVGRTIGSPQLTIIDDGTLPGAIGTVPFDDEGIPSAKKIVIDKGELETFLLDTASSRKINAKSTGNAFRASYRDVPSVHPTNFFIKPGEYSREMLLSSAGCGFYINSLTNTGGFNATSGSFSLAAAGKWIENGELTYPVDSVTISGSIAGVMKNLIAAGADFEWRGATGAPSLLFSEMDVTGG